MTPELKPQETDAIRREAEEYARKVIPRNPMPEDKDFDLFEVYAESYAAALTSERLKHKAEIQAYREVIALKDEYIQLLVDELNDMAGAAYVHGWRSTRVEKGQELRDKISKIKL